MCNDKIRQCSDPNSILKTKEILQDEKKKCVLKIWNGAQTQVKAILVGYRDDEKMTSLELFISLLAKKKEENDNSLMGDSGTNDQGRGLEPRSGVEPRPFT